MPGHVANRGQRKDGSTKWRAHWQHPYDPSITREKMHRNHKVALKFISDLDSEAHEGKLKPADHTTKRFTDLVDLWRKVRWPSLAPRTRARAESTLNAHLLPEFGKTRVVDIDRAAVRTYYGKLKARANDGEFTSGTAHKIAGVLSAIMTEAVESEWVDRNPCYRQRKLLGSSAPARKAQFLSRPEIERLYDTMDPRYRLLVRCAAYTGLRQSELLALQRRHVDLLHVRINVERAVTEYVDGYAVYGPTKTRKSRVVGIEARLKAELSAHLDTLPGGPDALVFAPADGKRWWLSTWRRNYWTPAVEEAFGDRDLRFHDLRHTCASLLIASGANIKEVMEWMGHATVQMTLGLYSHLFPNAINDLADRLGEPDAGVGVLSPAEEA